LMEDKFRMKRNGLDLKEYRISNVEFRMLKVS